MTYAVTKAADGTYSVACDGYVIVSGLTHAEVKAMVEELNRLAAEMDEETRHRKRRRLKR